MKLVVKSDAVGFLLEYMDRLDVTFCEIGRAMGSGFGGAGWVIAEAAGRPKLSRLNKLCARSLFPLPLVWLGGVFKAA